MQQAEKVIIRFAADILEGKSFSVYTSKGFSGRMMSGPVNRRFYSRYVHAKGFHVTDKCIGCGNCATLCPLNNITMEAGRPIWADNCTHCMACINLCPVSAIEYENKTQGQFRYSYDKMTE